jgi:epoxyqueuosine reductase
VSIENHHPLAAAIKSRAIDLGFTLVGITSAQPPGHLDYFRQWLDTGSAGNMHYLQNRFDERTDPAVYFPGTRSIVCVAVNYHVPLDTPPPSRNGRIARYALGGDYHTILQDRLHELADWLREQVPGTQTRCAVDTAPIMEKELAARAGIGWMGKNTCIIHPQVGSWLLLGEMLTTLDLPADDPGLDRCGSCTRCIDACPTGAITEPYQLDARRCISYLTIEHRDEIPVELQPKLKEWIYGCDICQDVCPWNRKAPVTTDADFKPRFPSGTVPLDAVIHWTDADYRRELKRSAIKRVKLPVLQRTAKVVEGNFSERT